LNRRDFLRALGVGAASLVLPGCAGGLKSCYKSPGGKGKLNFVFILIDDMGWSDLPCYGHKFHETPNIDRLARQGMRFTSAYASPVCSPTRAAIMAGQYPARLGITDFISPDGLGHQRPWAKLLPPRINVELPLQTVTLAEALQQAGYTTGLFGKWHLGFRPQFLPKYQGFDEMLVQRGTHFNFKTIPPTELDKDAYLAEVLTGRAEKFLEDNKDKSFFLYLTHFAVHIPLQARQELIEKYKNKPRPAAGVNNPTYAAMVEHVDRSVGRILKKLDELNLSDNTMVIFFSDNGGLRKRFDKQGPVVTTNAPLRDEKGSLYEGGIREPLIVRWPGVVEPGTLCNQPVTAVDFYPTLVEIAGGRLAADCALDGESILPLLTQAGSLRRDAIYWHYPHYHHARPAGAVRQGDWKLIEQYETGQLQLYNLAADIGEQHNLAEQMPEKARRLQQKLAQWRKSVGAQMPAENPMYDPARAGQWGR